MTSALAPQALADAQLDGLIDAAAWTLSVPGASASCAVTVRAVTAVGPAGQRQVVALARLERSLRDELERGRAYTVSAADGSLAVELQLESLTRSGPLALLVGEPAGGPGIASEPTAPVSIPTRDGPTRMVGVLGELGEEALLVEIGRPGRTAGTIVYVHRGCRLGDALGSRCCPSARWLRRAVAKMRERDGGVVVYLREEESLGSCCLARSQPPPSAALCAGLRRALGRLGLGPVELVATAAQAGWLGGLGLEVWRTTEPR